jgi:hypothetical protein
MRSSQYPWGHRFNIAGWVAVASFFIVLPFVGKPAFILLTLGGLSCALALAVYKSPLGQECRVDGAAPKQSASPSGKSLYAPQPPVDATELWRFKVAAWFALALGVAAFSFIFRYGDAPRPFVEWLTAYVLAPIVAVMFAILGYAMLRFGRACRSSAAQNVRTKKSDETLH